MNDFLSWDTQASIVAEIIVCIPSKSIVQCIVAISEALLRWLQYSFTFVVRFLEMHRVLLSQLSLAQMVTCTRRSSQWESFVHTSYWYLPRATYILYSGKSGEVFRFGESGKDRKLTNSLTTLFIQIKSRSPKLLAIQKLEISPSTKIPYPASLIILLQMIDL